MLHTFMGIPLEVEDIHEYTQTKYKNVNIKFIIHLKYAIFIEICCRYNI